MKRRLKVSVETMLAHTPAPEPQLHYAKSAQKRAYLSAVERKYARRTPKVSGWHAGRSAIMFAGIGLLVMIGAGTLLAQAGQARPGHPLYMLNRSLERTQLALTQDEHDKLALKINFAEERLEAVADSSVAADAHASVAATEALNAVSAVDQELDNAKLALELNQQTDLTRRDVEQLSANFRTVLSDYQNADLPGGEQAAPGTNEPAVTSLDSVLSEIRDLVEQELAQTPVADGFYIQLSGLIAGDGAGFTTVFGEHELTLTGLLSQPSFAGQRAEMRGVLKGASLAPDRVQIGGYEFEIKDDGSIGFKTSATLQQDETGFFFTGEDNWRLNLTGELTSDEDLAQLTGRVVSAEGQWIGELVELNRVSAQTEQGEVVLPKENGSNEDMGESLPATDPVLPDTPPPGFER